jgi:hypothetical protein
MIWKSPAAALASPSDVNPDFLLYSSLDSHEMGRAVMRKATKPGQVRVLPAYPIIEFCREFGVCKSIAYQEIRAGRLKSFTVGAKRLVAGEDALAWRDRHRGQSAA